MTAVGASRFGFSTAIDGSSAVTIERRQGSLVDAAGAEKYGESVTVSIDDAVPAAPLVLERRELLIGATAIGCAAALPGCDDAETDAPPSLTFQHGVASGDALADAVILWTRVTTDAPAPTVKWTLATDVDLTAIVASGEVATDASRDFTVKLDVTGLSAATTYYYRFTLDGEPSPLGRTRTLPAGATPGVRLAVVSCSSYAHGYFHVYRSIAGRPDLDGVVHLGDYIYEYGNGEYGEIREYDPPTEIRTLDDYRRRYAHYRKDADLREVHRQHVFFTVWDDHEFANNAYPDGAENHDPASEGAWADRKAAALQAYSEWMPIRAEDPAKIYRSFRFGDAVELFLCDTRMWGRTPQATSNDDPSIEDPARTLLGTDQEKWLLDGLRDSTARFKLVGQQVMMAQLPLASLRNNDQWDGYPQARKRFLDLCKDGTLKDVVVLTGDIHTSWASDLIPDGDVYDPLTGAGAVAVELVCPGVTSPGLGDLLAPIAIDLMNKNPRFKLVDITKRGYLVLDVDETRTQGAYFHMDQVELEARPTETMSGAFSLIAGARKLVADAEAAPGRADAPPLAPEET